MEYLLIYVGFCLGVAFLGKNRKMGFWGYLFFSLLLTPFVGLIMIFASDPRENPKSVDCFARRGSWSLRVREGSQDLHGADRPARRISSDHTAICEPASLCRYS